MPIPTGTLHALGVINCTIAREAHTIKLPGLSHPFHYGYHPIEYKFEFIGGTSLQFTCNAKQPTEEELLALVAAHVKLLQPFVGRHQNGQAERRTDQTNINDYP